MHLYKRCMCINVRIHVYVVHVSMNLCTVCMYVLTCLHFGDLSSCHNEGNGQPLGHVMDGQ